MRVVVLLSFLALAVRLVMVQGLSGGHYAAIGTSEVTTTVSVPAERGGIYDRNGAVLAVSEPRSTVVADPYLVSHPVGEAAALAGHLGVAESSLVTELSRRTGYVVLATRVAETTAKKIDGLHLPGINLLPATQRVDPVGTLAAPVIGAVNGSGAGASGIEYEYDKMLAGHAGKAVLHQTPDAVPLPGGSGGSGAVAGSGLELTIDEQLQYVTEQALGAEVVASHAKSGTAIVMDSHTGQVLAMADLVADPARNSVAEAPLNNAVAMVYEPGSVFKLVTFSAALTAGLITPQEPFSVPNTMSIDGWTFHDAENHPTEQLTATQILAQSSNIGTIEIANLLGRTRLAQQIASLGFGRPSGLRFPGESAGLVNGDAATWSGSAMGATPIGQDDSVTPQQVLDMVNAVATGGVFVPPSLVRAVVRPDGTLGAAAPPSTRRVFSGAVATTLTTMMEQVVQDGTAVAAAIPGYTVAGKTGTAQVPDNKHGGYVPGAYMATFAGFAPAQDPVLSAVVVLEQPTPIFGGTVAAPVFAQVMGYALHRYGVAPDQGGPGGSGTAPAPLSGSPVAQGGTATIAPTAGSSTGRP
ncbi:MAG: penicillin-binding protein 2 [Acidobacteriota bacterium]|nr:penicillin-binding protein 2 [Acidobacteriota bacterium]